MGLASNVTSEGNLNKEQFRSCKWWYDCLDPCIADFFVDGVAMTKRKPSIEFPLRDREGQSR